MIRLLLKLTYSVKEALTRIAEILARFVFRIRPLGYWGFVCCVLTIPSYSMAIDLSVVPLLDGERDGLNNYWGGPFGTHNMNGVSLETSIVHSGSRAYRVDLGSLPANTLSFFQSFSSERTSLEGLRQTRDLTRYQGFQGHVRNDTNSSLDIRMELKDYRDSNSHRASKTFTIPANSSWTQVATDFDLNAGWNVIGNPDLERIYITSFVINEPHAVAGSYYFDDFAFIEPGGSLNSQTAPIESVVERLAERHFSGLWSSRNRTSGLIYNHKDDVNLAAMNTTGGTIWMLPKAIERGWVSQTDADAFVSQVVTSLNTNLDQSSYLPTRFIDPLTAGLPGGNNEESSIDSSFIALALHNYKRQENTPTTLQNQLDEVQNRFQLDAFAIPAGFRFAYFPSSGFSPGTYMGYTNEGKVISLAAEVSDSHHVPLEEHWNADTSRSRNYLVNPNDAHLTHSLPQYRAPFEQALLNLFVDTSERGVDNYPDRGLATNPWQNFVRYQREVAAKLQELGRANLFQPDAASGAPFSGYHQYSLYEDFGQSDLFMPWSVAFAMLAGTEGADQALRALLDVDGVMGPLGLADSVRWTTGSSAPNFISNSGDNWNTVLSTMALMELLDKYDESPSASSSFALMGEIASALDEVFVDGDLDGDGQADGLDLAIWETGYGIALGATPIDGDTDGDGDVDSADFLRWQRGVANSHTLPSTFRIPEPSTYVLACVVLLIWHSKITISSPKRFSIDSRKGGRAPSHGLHSH